MAQETGAELKEPAIYSFSLLLSARLSKYCADLKLSLTE